MNIFKAKRILESEGVRLRRIDESKPDSKNYNSAYETKYLVKGSEEAPEGYDQQYSIYWDEREKAREEGYYETLGCPEELELLEVPLNGGRCGDEVKWVVKKLWYRIAEFMINRDNEPCSAADIKRGLGLEGYSQSFAQMKKDGFLQEVGRNKLVLADWAAEKYYAAKEHAEEERIAKERECIRKYGTLEDQMKRHDRGVAQIRDGFKEFKRNYEQKLKDQRKQDVKDYFDKRKGISESF